jgi:hypothetical protein
MKVTIRDSEILKTIAARYLERFANSGTQYNSRNGN